MMIMLDMPRLRVDDPIQLADGRVGTVVWYRQTSVPVALYRVGVRICSGAIVEIERPAAVEPPQPGERR